MTLDKHSIKQDKRDKENTTWSGVDSNFCIFLFVDISKLFRVNVYNVGLRF